MAQITNFTVKSISTQGTNVIVQVQFSTGDLFSISFDGDATSSYMVDMIKKEAAARNRADTLNTSLQSSVNAVISVP